VNTAASGAVPVRPFSLTRWFAITSLVCVSAISLVAAEVMSRLFTDRLLRRDAEVTMEFVQSIVAADEFAGHFSGGGDPARRAVLEDTFRRIAQIPDVLRANAYTTDGTVLLSTDRGLVGRNLGRNEELDDALAGRLVFNSGLVRKAEHAGIAAASNAAGVPYFIEIYVPIRSGGDANGVVGVVELYKAPDELSEAIRQAHRIVWMSAILGALVLFGALFWIARRADSIMRHQQQRLVQAETLALVGEMASAVAHAVRNPLAAIRSSAEMAAETGPSPEQSEDIVRAVDRIEGWVRELLGYTQPVHGQRLAVDANAVIRKILGEFQRELTKRQVELVAKLDERLPPVRGDAALLGQVINSLVANAADAVSAPGRIEVKSRVAADARHVEIDVADNGVGIPEGQLDTVFKPFFTTKPRGLGLGLPLAKRALEHYDGALNVASTPGVGTTFTISLSVEP
jgi:two-component system, NtrC family, sensor histidine kinase HydH